MKLHHVFFISLTFLKCTTVNAETTWSSTNIQFLSGSDYLNPYNNAKVDGSVITFENSSSTTWGKSYNFIDLFQSDEKSELDDSTYLELGVDISLTGTSGYKSEIKDLFIATQLENGSATNFINLLAGVGLRWNIPGFTFIDTNIYYRSNDDYKDNFQQTTAWNLPFTIANLSFQFDGFYDLTSSTKNADGSHYKYTFHTQSQLKVDVGKFWQEKNKYYVGVEIDYWKNYLGIKGAEQTALQIMAQAFF